MEQALKPYYRVYIGKPETSDWSPYEISHMVTDVSVSLSGTQDTGTATVVIDNKDNIHNDFITISKARIRIDMGYLGANNVSIGVEERIFTGVSTAKHEHDSKKGGEYITLDCSDYSDMMRNVKITKTYEGMKFQAIMEEFASICYPDDPGILIYNKSGLIPSSVSEFVYTSGTESALEIDQTPVWDVVVQLCDEWGLSTWFDRYGKWHIDAFGTDSLGRQQRVYEFEKGVNMADFHGTISTPASVVATVEVTAYKEDEQEEKLGSFSRPLDNVIQNAVLTLNNDKIVSNEYAVYLARKRLAIEQSQYKNVELSTQFGIPFITNGDFIQIKGKGVFDDLYWIRSITHTLNKKNGYTMDIKADQIPFILSVDGTYPVPPPVAGNYVNIDESKNCVIELQPPIPDGAGGYDASNPTNRFGWREHPVYGSSPYLGNDGVMHVPAKQHHDGIDIDAGYNTAVLAAHAGKVTYLGYVGTHKSPTYTDANGKKIAYGTEGTSYGNTIEITGTMCGSTITTKYAHLCCSLSQGGFNTVVKQGQSVSAGDVIGYVGDTGLALDAHLHFELKVNGTLVDPALYVKGYH